MRTILTVTIEHDDEGTHEGMREWVERLLLGCAYAGRLTVTHADTLTVRGEAVDVAEFVKPKPDNEGWIEWHGGERPVGEFDDVDVVWRSGEQFNDCQANFWVWSHSNDEDDIIRYRIAGGQ